MNINDFFEMGPIGTELELSPTILAFPPFQKILIGRDDVKNATNEIKFILWRYTWNTPYNVISPDRRDAMIKSHLFGDSNYEISQNAKYAIDEYVKEFQTSETLEMLKSARIGIWYINDYFRNISSSDSIVDPKLVQQLVKELGNSHKSLDTLEKAAKRESESKTVRGGSEIGDYELPKSKSFM